MLKHIVMWKFKDAEGKTKALRTVAAGAIVAAICFALKSTVELNPGDITNGGTTTSTSGGAIHRIINI